jgi:hypothetical protein
MTLGDGFGTTEDASQAIAHLLDGARADRLLGDGHLFPQGSEATVPPYIRAEGTQTGTSRSHRRILVHGARLSARGHVLSLAL